MIRFLILAYICTFFYAFSQDIRCASDVQKNVFSKEIIDSLENEYKKEISLNKKTKKQAMGIIKIPIVVHVVHSSKDSIIGENGNISDEQIISQIAVLNEDFRRKTGTNGFNNLEEGADIEIEFSMASTDPDCKPTNGITRHYSSKRSYDPTTEEDLVKSADYWSNRSYLNIWVCSLSGGYLGFAQYPNSSGLEGIRTINGTRRTDGLLIRHNCFGRSLGTASSGLYSYGRTATHEIGHWLGLLHTTGDNNCGSDYCEDTPQCESLNNGRFCTELFSKCRDDRPATRNMTENYLDYSPDICMNIFTKDQKTRMRSVFENAPDRIALLNTKGYEQQKISQFPLILDFEKGNETEDNWMNMSTISENWKYTSTGGNQALMIELNNSETRKSATFTTQTFLDLTTIPNPIMLFDVAYPEISNSDSLIISAYVGCRSPAIPLLSFTGNSLITSKKTSLNFPLQKDDWKTHFVNLKDLKEQKYIKLQVTNVSKSGAKLFIDNIRFINTSENLETKLYENPFYVTASALEKEIKMNVLFSGTPTDVRFEVYDINGKILIEKTFSGAFPGDFTINASGFSNGMYLIKTTVNLSTKTNKLVVY